MHVFCLAIGLKLLAVSEEPETHPIKRLRATILDCGSLGGGGRMIFSHSSLPWHTAQSSVHNRHSMSVKPNRIQMTEIEEEEE